MKKYAVILTCLTMLGGSLIGQPVDENTGPANTSIETSPGGTVNPNPDNPPAPASAQGNARPPDSALAPGAPAPSSSSQNITEPSGATSPGTVRTPVPAPDTGAGTSVPPGTTTSRGGAATATTVPSGAAGNESADIFLPSPATSRPIIVIIEGIVNNEAERTQLERRLQVVPGISAVISRLQVAGQTPPATATPPLPQPR